MQLAQRFEVSNPGDGVVVITPDPEKPKSYLRFEAKGDSLGNDVMFLSRAQVEQPDFMKAVQRGLLAVKADYPEGDGLANELKPKRQKKREEKPLTVARVIFDESDDYKMKTEDVKVIVEPSVRV
jgi:hypothetical protein